jgi:hypothetical protein
LTIRVGIAIFRVRGQEKPLLSLSRGVAVHVGLLSLTQSDPTAKLKEEKPMKSLRTSGGWGVFLAIMLGLGSGGSEVRADALHGITDLGTLSGQSSSVATGINDNGQVVGISYNSSDGSFGG